jgi:hypothetical protein
MTRRFNDVALTASTQHGAVSTRQLDALGVNASLRAKWIARGLLARAGPRAFTVVGSPETWRRDAWAAAANVDGMGYVAGRSAARLHGLDGFVDGPLEVLLRREHRGARLPYVAHATSRPLGFDDVVMIDGIRCLTAERLIVESPLFGFTQAETENAIDSAIRARKAHEGGLRQRVLEVVGPGVAGAMLRDALIDTGGESRLERWFLGITRRGRLPPPRMRVVVRAGNGFSARLDASFPGNLVVELEGHATHSSRRQRQHDEERRTRLTLQGLRVIVFTYLDVRDRPDWVLAQLRAALALAS